MIKVMKISVLLMLLIALPMLSLKAQEGDSLPFVYVQFDPATQGYIMQVIDVLSGNILYTIDRAQHTCSGSLSPDGRWLLYHDFDGQKNILRDLETGEESVFHEGRQIKLLHWQDNDLFYWDGYGLVTPEHLIYQYDLAEQENHVLKRIASPDEVVAVRWVNHDPVLLIEGDDSLSIHRRSNTVETYDRPNKAIAWIDFSSNTRYISYNWRNNSNLLEAVVLDTQTKNSARLAISNYILWFHHSDRAVYADLNGDIVVYDALTKESRIYAYERVADERPNFNLYLSPDDRYIAFVMTATQLDIESPFTILETHTGDYFTIGKKANANFPPMKWMDSTHLAYLNPPDTGSDHLDLWVYDTLTGESINLTNTPDLSEDFDCFFG